MHEEEGSLMNPNRLTSKALDSPTHRKSSSKISHFRLSEVRNPSNPIAVFLDESPSRKNN